MARLTSSFTAFFLLLSFSCFVSHCSSRPISSANSASDPPKAAVGTAGKFGQELWFDHPWFSAHSPHPGYWHKKPWSFAHSPKSHDGGYEWDHWPMPEKEWPFAHSPKSHDGWKWWPKVAADQIEEAKAATPPIAA